MCMKHAGMDMDKEVMKRLCRERGLPIVEYITLTRAHAAPPALPFPYPVFVKPANLGSSVGISKVTDAAGLGPALEFAAQFDRKIIVERGIAGKELECSVLGNEDPVAATPCEILPSRDFYDYEDKYLLDRAAFRLPADLSPEQTAELRRLAAHKMANEAPGHTLQPTALVHEAWLRLAGSGQQPRGHL